MAYTEGTAGSVDSCIGRSVSLDHAAELLGVSRRTIYNRIREGRLQTIRTRGGSQRVLLASMLDVRAQRTAAGLETDRMFRSYRSQHSP